MEDSLHFATRFSFELNTTRNVTVVGYSIDNGADRLSVFVAVFFCIIGCL